MKILFFLSITLLNFESLLAQSPKIEATKTNCNTIEAVAQVSESNQFTIVLERSIGEGLWDEQVGKSNGLQVIFAKLKDGIYRVRLVGPSANFLTNIV